MSKQKCITCGAPVTIEGHTTMYYVNAYDTLMAEAMKLREELRLVMKVSDPFGITYQGAREAIDAFDQFLKTLDQDHDAGRA